MYKTLNAIALSAALALGLTAGTFDAADAATPVRAAISTPANPSLVEAQYRHHRGGGHNWHHGGGGRYYGHDRYYGRRGYYGGGSGFYLGFGTPYYGGYYSPYYARPYYARPTYVVPAYRGGSAHVRWCYNRYRSYRASDNTYQPYNGPRRQCYSPYR